MSISPVTPAAAVQPDAGATRFDQAVERSKSEQVPAPGGAWAGEWERRVEARDQARATGNEALAQHFQAELDVMQPVMDTMSPGSDTDPAWNAKEAQQPPVVESAVAEPESVRDSGAVALQPDASVNDSVGGSQTGLHLPAQLEPFRDAIQQAADASGVPANVIAGMIWDESRGDIGALTVNGGNGLGDTGLMQVNPETFKELQAQYPELLGGKELNDPATNIMAGALYVKEQLADFGSLDLALRAYNSGPLNVNPDNVADISRYGTGTASYVEKVNNYADIIGSGNGTLPA